MELREPLFLDEEATVEELAKGYFWDKALINNMLFEISKGEQNALKRPPNAPKSGWTKNFHFGAFGVKKCKNLPFLRNEEPPLHNMLLAMK